MVVDASAIVDLLAARPEAEAIRVRLATVTEVHVPEHFHVEVISALSGLLQRGERDLATIEAALGALLDLRAIVHPVAPLAWHVWDLRERLTAYDAGYLALARSLDMPLLTTDRALAVIARAEGRAALG